MANQYTQYILPFASNFGGGQVQYILLRDTFDLLPDVDPDCIILDEGIAKAMLQSVGNQFSDYEEQGNIITSEMAEVVLNNIDKFSGVSDGSPVSDQDVPDGILKHIFDGVRVTLIKRFLLANDDWEYYFTAEIDNDKTNTKHVIIENERTSLEIPIGASKRFQLLAGLDRLKNTKVRDLLRTIDSSHLLGWDDGGTKRPYAIYGGLCIRSGSAAPVLFKDEFRLPDKDSFWNDKIAGQNVVTSRAVYATSNATTDKITTIGVDVASTFPDDTPVRFTFIDSGYLPQPLVSHKTYYVVNAEPTFSRFQVSLTIGGSAIDITGTDLYMRIAVVTGTAAADINNFDRVAYKPLPALNEYPSGFWGITVDSVIGAICDLSGVGFQYTTPSDDEHSLAYGRAIWNPALGEYGGYEREWPTTVTGMNALAVIFNVRFGVNPNRVARTLVFASTTDEAIYTLQAEDNDPFADGDLVNFRKTDSATMPDGLETFTDYYVVNATRTSDTVFTFQLSDVPGGTPIDLLDDGSGEIQCSNQMQINWPTSHAWDDPLSDVIKRFCEDNGFIPEFDYDQTNGQPILKLSRRRKTEGTVPAWIKYEQGSGSEQPSDGEARAVKAGYLEDTNTIVTPVREEQKNYNVSVSARVHNWSDRNGNIHHNNLRYDDGRGLEFQSLTFWQPESGGDESQYRLHDDGWILGAQYFDIKTDGVNDRHPGAWDAYSLDLDDNENWRGLYAYDRVRYRDYEESESDTIYELDALLLANELLLDPVKAERSYGFDIMQASSVSLRDLKCRQTATFGPNTLRSCRVEFNEFTGLVTYQFKTAPDMDTLNLDLPIYQGSGSGRATKGTGTGTNTTTNTSNDVGGSFLKVSPKDSIDNETNPGTGNTDTLIAGINQDGDRTSVGFRSDTGKVVKLRAVDGMTGSYDVEFPTDEGTVNQSLIIDSVSSSVIKLRWDTGTSGDNSIFGTGYLGSLTFDGSSVVAGLTPAGNIYTMSRDIYCTYLEVQSGVTLFANGFRVFVAGDLLNDGTIHNNGNNGSTSTGGVATNSTGPTGHGTTGGGGAVVPGNGTGGTNSIFGTVSAAGAGSGGNAGAGIGGGPGTNTTPSDDYGGQFAFDLFATRISGLLHGSGGFVKVGGGAGGGGGAADIGGTGGGAGSGAGTLVIGAISIENNGAIEVIGGTGANGVAGNGGGGGGGQGGNIFFIYRNFTGNPGDASGGTGGTGSGTGLNGVNGADGLVIETIV